IERRWRIRTPELAVTRRVDAMATDRAVAGALVESLAGIHEDGGEVTNVVTRGGAPVGALVLASIQGTLRDGGTGAPVAGARVFVSGTQHAAVTDSAGHFRMDGVDEGSYAVSYVHPRLDSLNLAPPVEAVSVKAGDAAEVALRLPAAPVRVAQAPAAAAQGSAGRPIPLERVSALAQGRGRQEFYQRAAHGQGSYVTREQIERMRGARTTDLFRGIPSLEVIGGTLRVRTPGNQAPRGLSALPMDPAGGGGRIAPNCAPGVSADARASAEDCEKASEGDVQADCKPSLWVDGQAAPGGIGDISSLFPQDIEGIEVYARAATAPGQYKRLNSDCAIILIWTRNESGSTVHR
ncbi:MAG TPA: carboxypeptidase regulatory-like domain-containing protein, partial [Longimicrobiaceae bacterium]|nr:carboxypeptidase regulatory-like domain-containing protein [Longimicrobiaceae bacterium]